MKNSLIKSTSQSTINRSSIKKNILKAVKEAGKPISTAEIAKIINKNWHTIIRYCLDLENEKRLTKFEVGRINIWQIKK
ncbi:hypothetical protein ACFL0X_00130 [Nanoarchaeota archaeon]